MSDMELVNCALGLFDAGDVVRLRLGRRRGGANAPTLEQVAGGGA